MRKQMPETGSKADILLGAIIDAWIDETPCGKWLKEFYDKKEIDHTIRSMMNRGLMIIIEDEHGYTLEPTIDFLDGFPSISKH